MKIVKVRKVKNKFEKGYIVSLILLSNKYIKRKVIRNILKMIWYLQYYIKQILHDKILLPNKIFALL